MSEVKYHSKFYYKDSSFRMKLRDTLYNVHLGLLAHCSEVFKTMLTMPTPGDMQVEGSSDDTPMILPESVEKEKLDVLLVYMFEGACLSKAIGDALDEITGNIAHLMGPNAFYILTQTHTHIKNHLTGLAFYPPDPIVSLQCWQPGKCSEGWVLYWWQSVTKHLLHPDSGMSGAEILEALEKVKIPGMCCSCQTENVDWVKESGGMMKTQNFTQEAVDSIVTAYGSLAGNRKGESGEGGGERSQEMM
ncbi:hypothetical protein OE88DRAFT_1734152 [Heliocybe sulcata]|uniref:BTB domain-containing protein n=1 Tax=Heliocybe sulcata TaxID=5364 RepID=A0A5C3N696_9AGAM|nr:hypothetical protein OE88DRAFT_1734152 [Heliocybe sulcata]